jgi:O-antigen/teichoic acid export membrane protein
MQMSSSIDAPASPSSGATLAYRRRTIAINFAAMAAVSGIVLLVGIFTTAYTRRVLGPAAIGQVNWNAALLAFLTLLANPGLAVVGQRDIAANPKATASIASLVLGLQALFGLAAYAVVAAIALLDPRGGQAATLLLIQGLIIVINAGSVLWVLQAHQRMAGPAIASLVVNLLQVPAMLALIREPGDIYLFVAYTLPFSLALVGYYYWDLRRHGVLRLREVRPTLASAGGLLAQAWPMALSLLAVAVVYNSGALLLGFSHGDTEVGLYTTAYKLMFISTVVSGAMMSAYFPVLSQVAGDARQARRVARDFAILMVWMGLPIAALGWACGRHVNDLLFGAQYAAAGPYFEWLCLVVAFTFTNIGLGTPLLTWGRQRLHLKIIGSVALASLALNALLVPQFGGWGAVAALLATEAASVTALATVRRRLPLGRIPLLRLLAPPVLCSSIVALGIAALPPAADRFWWLEVAIGTALLGGCLLLFERRIARAAWSLVRRRPPS